MTLVLLWVFFYAAMVSVVHGISMARKEIKVDYISRDDKNGAVALALLWPLATIALPFFLLNDSSKYLTRRFYEWKTKPRKAIRTTPVDLH